MFAFSEGWVISDQEFNPATELKKGSVYTLANGYMGNRGALEEMDADMSRRTAGTEEHASGDPLIPVRGRFVGNYLAGIYDTADGTLREREIVNAPNWALIRCWVDGELVDPTSGEILSFQRWMNFREAVLHREMTWRSPGGKRIQIHTSRFVSMDDYHLGFVLWKLQALDACEIMVQSGIDADVINTQKDHFRHVSSETIPGGIYLEAETHEMKYRMGTAVSHSTCLPEGVEFSNQKDIQGESHALKQYDLHLESDESFELVKYAAVYTSRDTAELRESCESALEKHTAFSYEACQRVHIERWERLWRTADFAVQGDEEVQIGMRCAIYHLINSAPHHSDSVSYPARSLSGQDHWGTIHWDTEIFILPFFTYQFPDAARNMLIYRYRGLEGAREKAQELGFKGAFYAWRSHEDDGKERCPWRVNKNVLTGRYIRNYFRDRQIHISADIVYAVWQYFEATADMEFLEEYGAEMVLEAARFYASRVIYDSRRKLFRIKGVMGPDEYHEVVDDNAYTNAMVRFTFHTAFRILKLLETRFPKRTNELLKAINLTDEEMASWNQIVEELFVPEPDPKTGLIEQFHGYFKREDISVQDLLSRKVEPHHFLGGRNGLVAGTQVIKQADVVMLHYLLREEYSREIKRANWGYFEPRTEHGSSLSPMGYALVAADTGMVREAYRYFLHSVLMDVSEPGSFFSGYYNHGVHPCAMAGAWLTIVHGFCGITLSGDGVVWRKPYMPSHWEELAFSLQWKEVVIRFCYQEGVFRAQAEKRVPFKTPDGDQVLTTDSDVVVEACRVAVL